MSIKVMYRTSAKATGGRDGRSTTLDGTLDVKLSTPKALGGTGGTGNNPEQLFAAGYAACFIGAMKVAAADIKGLVVPVDTSVIANVGIGPRAEGGFGLTISLAIELPGLKTEIAQKLIDDAHQICPYSNATRNNIDVGLSLV
ncbi:MAG: organic hydroperoxide resistance protein [Rhizobiales bacterium]|nr:organic hydroperoxide resistance protein [Hyphomicrobiales bacterium]